jgi:hypothetical protein
MHLILDLEMLCCRIFHVGVLDHARDCFGFGGAFLLDLCRSHEVDRFPLWRKMIDNSHYLGYCSGQKRMGEDFLDRLDEARCFT